jgi:hypothetical protein
MATLREAPIQPLDIILFHGIDPVSHAICFFEAKKFGHGRLLARRRRDHATGSIAPKIGWRTS